VTVYAGLGGGDDRGSRSNRSMKVGHFDLLPAADLLQLVAEETEISDRSSSSWLGSAPALAIHHRAHHESRDQESRDWRPPGGASLPTHAAGYRSERPLPRKSQNGPCPLSIYRQVGVAPIAAKRDVHPPVSATPPSECVRNNQQLCTVANAVINTGN